MSDIADFFFLLIRGFYIFYYCTLELVFVVFLLVFAKQSFACVKNRFPFNRLNFRTGCKTSIVF